MAAEGVGRQTDQLDAALGELGLELGKSTELGGADGSVVLGVGEKDDPVVTNELVEVNGTGGGLGLEVGGNGTQAEASREKLSAPVYKHCLGAKSNEGGTVGPGVAAG